MLIQNYLFILFGIVVVGFLILDLGYFNRKAHKISPKVALTQTLFWVVLSLGFASLIYIYLGKILAVEFLSAYVTEKMLSVDNLFVIVLIFSFFNLEEKYHHRVLFWGILGAIVFRAIFILAGIYIVSQFHWVLYVFGMLLVLTGIKFYFQKRDKYIDFNNNKVLKFVRRYLPFTTNYHNGKFIVRENGKLMFTSLLLIVLLVETTDIVFAIDSIPTAFIITQNSFIIFTSNIFAVMGLRALFFLLENALHYFHHLQKGLAFVLVFIGLKMLVSIVGIHLSSLFVFVMIMLILGISLLLSVIKNKRHATQNFTHN